MTESKTGHAKKSVKEFRCNSSGHSDETCCESCTNVTCIISGREEKAENATKVSMTMYELGRLFIYLFFFRGRFCFFWVPGSMLSCFSEFLLFCFSAFLLLCFSASMIFCFSAFLFLCFSCFSAFLLFAFPASLLFLLLCFSAFCFSLLLCFSASLFSLLLCFCISVPFYFYYSTFSFLQSCVFAAPLPAPLLLCFLSLLSLCFSFFLLYSVLFVSQMKP